MDEKQTETEGQQLIPEQSILPLFLDSGAVSVPTTSLSSTVSSSGLSHKSSEDDFVPAAFAMEFVDTLIGLPPPIIGLPPPILGAHTFQPGYEYSQATTYLPPPSISFYQQQPNQLNMSSAPELVDNQFGPLIPTHSSYSGLPFPQATMGNFETVYDTAYIPKTSHSCSQQSCMMLPNLAQLSADQPNTMRFTQELAGHPITVRPSPFKVSNSVDETSFTCRASLPELRLEPVITPETTVIISVESAGEIEEFLVHKKLLCSQSTYFSDIFNKKQDAIITKARISSKMMRREWRWENVGDIETMEGNGFGDIDGKIEIEVKIKLPETVSRIRLDPEEVGPIRHLTFSAFIDWLYHGFNGFRLQAPATEQPYNASNLIELYFFAGKVDIAELQNDCVEGVEFLRATTKIIQAGNMGWVYKKAEETKGECKLKNLLVDQCVWDLDPEWISKGGLDDEAKFPRKALIDMVGKMRVLIYEKNCGGVKAAPFATLESRKTNYWIPLKERRRKTFELPV